MTDPSDRPTAESLLRSRFPESEGWRTNVETHGKVTLALARRPHIEVSSNSLAGDYSERDNAEAVIAAWDAATHREQVRAALNALQVLIAEAPANVFTKPDTVCYHTQAQIDALRAGAAALAALPDSMKED